MANTINIANNPVLNQVVTGYSVRGMIRDMVLPKIRVRALTGDIPTKNGDHLRIVNNLAGEKSTTPEIDFTISKATGWSIDSYGLKLCVTKEDGERWDPTNPQRGMLEAKRRMAKLIRDQQLLQSENALAGTIFDDSNYDASNTVTLAGADQYNGATSTPIDDFQAARVEIFDDTGLVPNVAVMPWEVFQVIKYHTDLISLISNDANKLMGLTPDQLAVAMNVDKVIVASVKKNSAAKGATQVLSSVWAKNIMFAYVNPNPTPDVIEDSFGYTFEKEAVTADSYKVADPKDAEFVRVTERHDDLILNFDAAYLIKDAVA